MAKASGTWTTAEVQHHTTLTVDLPAVRGTEPNAYETPLKPCFSRRTEPARRTKLPFLHQPIFLRCTWRPSLCTPDDSMPTTSRACERFDGKYHTVNCQAEAIISANSKSVDGRLRYGDRSGPSACAAGRCCFKYDEPAAH